MPFVSKRQQRAAFSGAIPGFSKDRALQWAHETPDLKGLPDRAPAEKGKPTMRSKKAAWKGLFGQWIQKTAFAIPGAGQVMQSGSHVGSFPGAVTANFLKPSTSVSQAVTNPRRSIANAVKAIP